MLLEGSAQLTTSGNISGFAIFRYNPTGQEAVVPIESRNATGYLLAFDNTSSIATSISVNNVTSGTQQVSIPVVVRDDSGNLLGQHNLLLAPNGEFSGVLAQYSATLGPSYSPRPPTSAAPSSSIPRRALRSAPSAFALHQPAPTLRCRLW